MILCITFSHCIISFVLFRFVLCFLFLFFVVVVVVLKKEVLFSYLCQRLTLKTFVVIVAVLPGEKL